ncbi:hypothetical protein [Flavihumibacter petaseus]|uniref:Uncharacterized protein n=1 Tax=Flavihumibacter petaseus NBRC 106054 TaxID=1220578 RepID=A0A0E9N2B3_9BACT|nr:hypothetical protein [Flavihumibacter petaseus]GAO43811.1 hypothetical protein FPE01S_02_09170 [Flavihumibacter petaseus NBRC 106054]
MTVKAKFRCNNIVDSNFGTATDGSIFGNRKVQFSPVYGNSGENASFAKATPNGNLELQIDKSTPAYDFFKPGKEYYLTIEEATA